VDGIWGRPGWRHELGGVQWGDPMSSAFGTGLGSILLPRADAMGSGARLDSFARGSICGLRAAGVKRTDNVKKVRKKDGKRSPLLAARLLRCGQEVCVPSVRNSRRQRGPEDNAGPR
jgi:hypothetical protein